jgi:hypothetical protein
LNSSENNFEIQENFQSSTLNESQENDKLLEIKQDKPKIANEIPSESENIEND